MAVPSGTKMIRLEIVEGRDLLPSDVDAVVVNTSLATTSLQMKVGSIVSFRMGPELTSWHVVGIAREFFFSPPVAYIPQAFMDQRHPGMRTTAFLVLDKTVSINSVKDNLERRLKQEGVRILGSTSQVDFRFAVEQHMLMIYSALYFVFQLQSLFIWLIVSFCFSAVASFLPAWSASKITVREALTYE